MPDTIPDKPATPDDRRTAELRSLRQLITSPTQQALDELRKTVHRLHGEIHRPEELAKLLVPIISDVLQKKIAVDAKDVSLAIAPIIDRIFHERTQQDKAAIVGVLAPSVAKALREQHEKFPNEVAEDLAPLMGAAIREQIRAQRNAMVDAFYPIIGATIGKYTAESFRSLLSNINSKVKMRLESLMHQGEVAIPREPKAWTTLLPLLLLFTLLIGVPLGWHFYRKNQNQKTESTISSAIASSVGFTTNPIAVHANGAEVELQGVLPNELLRQKVIAVAQSASPTSIVQPSISISESPVHEALVASEVQRVTAAFNTLEGVNILSKFTSGAISLTGTVDDRRLVPTIVSAFERLPGVSSLTSSFNEGKPTISEKIYFEEDGSEMSESERPKLTSVTNILFAFPQIRLRIIGHSDDNGSKARNVPLTLGRAVAVKNALIALGIAENRLIVEGNGEPALQSDPQNPKNRCVRFEIFEAPGTAKE